MLKVLMFVMAVVVFIPRAEAATIVWEAFGAIHSSAYTFAPDSERPPDYPHLKPPVGTPYELQLVFDLDTLRHTVGAPAASPCSMVDVTGSFGLGGYQYGLGGWAFTNSALPGTTCGPGLTPDGWLEFFMFPSATDVAGAFNLNDGGPNFLNPYYVDRDHRDGSFPAVPAFDHDGTLYFQNDFFNFRAPFAPSVSMTQPAAVPEPGTMSLLGLGLAYVARRFRSGSA